MKKLISLLMALMMVLGCAAALAEDVIGGADEATEIVVTAESNLIMDGLLVTVVGLAGVFLVLILFFLTIKMMHKMLK